MLCEVGVSLNECHKSQLADPTIETHSMRCQEAHRRMHFSLHNAFSHFEMRTPTNEELSTCDKIFITPDKTEWNLHSDHHSLNEESMLDAENPLKQRYFSKLISIEYVNVC